MASQYVQQLTKVIVAQITQTIGWNAIQTTPLELLTDILHRYLEEVTRQTQRYAELYGRTEPNLNDVALAFNDMNINLSDIEEYIANVDPVPCIVNVPRFPIPKESNLNFLKPGSKEVVTRPVHINEHLPPMHPHEESPARDADDDSSYDNDNEDDKSSNLIQTYISTNQISDRTANMNGAFDSGIRDEFDDVVVGETTIIENIVQGSENDDDEKKFKKPAQPPQQHTHRHKDRKSLNHNERNRNIISKPTREIVSCFMTTSGFISPAREGKLPEARKPIIIPNDELPEEPETIVRSPSLEPVVLAEKKARKDRHDAKHDIDSIALDIKHTDRSYDDEDNENEVKLYEVIQTAPLEKSPPKKKQKKVPPTIDKIKVTKNLKKLRRPSQTTAKKYDGLTNDSATSGDANATGFNYLNPLQKQKKKLQKLESLKKKHRKERQLNLAPFMSNDNPEVQHKQRKKKMAKLLKKNMPPMDLNPNSIEGPTVPFSTGTNIAVYNPLARSADAEIKMERPVSQPKEIQKKSKQMDKQKIKFFKKLTSSSILSRPCDDLDRSTSPPATSPDFHSLDRAPTNVDNYNWTTAVVDSDEPPGKKSKQQKKIKPPKDLKPAKVKKLKEGKLAAKKPRIPKLPKNTETPEVPITVKLEKSPPPSSTTSHLLKPHVPIFPSMDLLNRFSGPGLIPTNPLFQPFQFDMLPNQMTYPFPGLPGFDFANMARFKRPNFTDSNDMASNAENTRDAETAMNTFGSKPLCNVASLMPPSMASEIDTMQSKSKYSGLIETYSSMKQSSTIMPNSFSSKKSSTVTTTSTLEQREPFSSPIVIDVEDDFTGRSSMSQSPLLSNINEPVVHGEEIKRKKNKDKGSKEGKKEKKDKEMGMIKVKKKKDKKDKTKNKLKHGEHSKSPKDKMQLKKEKRERKREKERAAILAGGYSYEGTYDNISEWSRDEFGRDGADTSSMDINADNSSMEANAIPKLTLKLGPSSSSPSSRTSRPSTPDFPATQRKSSKKRKKHWHPLEDEEGKGLSDIDEEKPTVARIKDYSEPMKRESSPEMARICALITRPPKPKLHKQNECEASAPLSRDGIDGQADDDYPIGEAITTPSTSRGRPKGSTSTQKISKSKAAKHASFSAEIETYDNQPTILNIQTNVLHTVDEKTNEESKVWICPACGKVDDGSPMIGCDGCDAWYHWPCVGIHVAPEEEQDWFCRNCISRKQEDKKKKRKKKDKKEH